MKKVLFATTALVLTAGVAAAEVTTTAEARMGLVYDGTDSAFSSRVRIKFAATGETDGGLSFGAAMRADQNGGNADGTANGDSTVFISGAFGKLTMGDVDSGANAAVGNVSGVGYTGLGDFNELGYIGSTKTAILYEYAAGDLTFYVGAGQVGSDDLSVGAKYAMGDYSFAIGYEDAGVDDQLTVGASAAFGNTTLKAVVADNSVVDDTQFALSVDHVIGATTVTAFYADQGNGVDGFGLGAAYDLGGGASLVGGVVDNSVDTVADLGVKFSF